MKALILKFLTDGLSPSDVVARLREAADTIEREGIKETDFERDGVLLGTLRLPDRKPALRGLNAPPKVTKPKADPSGPRRCDLGRAINFARGLEAELRLGAEGAAGLVLFDLIKPAARITQRLELLRTVTTPL